MFAKHELGAACLADYQDIKEGAIVPPVNELYSQVEEWLESNDWADLPDNFGEIALTDEEVESMRSTAYADSLTGSDRLLNDYQASLALGSDDAEDKKNSWLARREEIKSEYPFNS